MIAPVKERQVPWGMLGETVELRLLQRDYKDGLGFKVADLSHGTEELGSLIEATLVDKNLFFVCTFLGTREGVKFSVDNVFRAPVPTIGEDDRIQFIAGGRAFTIYSPFEATPRP